MSPITVDLTGKTIGGSATFNVGANCAAIRTGLYQTSGTDVQGSAPVAGTNNDFTNFTTGHFSGGNAKANYSVTTSGFNGFYLDGYQITIDSLVAGSTGGADYIILYYAPGADAQTPIFGNATAQFRVNLTGLPAAGPTVTGVSPASGPLGGANSVVITGTNFTGVTAVKFGTVDATSYTVNSNTQITAVAPAGSVGTVDITVTNNTVSPISAADQYTYVAAPTVTSISPTAGPTGGGTTVIITGTNLLATTGAGGVKFGATNATSYTINSSTQITATSPAGSAGTVDVTVTTPGGTSATSAADQFTYVAAPTVTSISPTSGPGSGGTVVTVTGTNFSGATAVTFGAAAAATFTVNSSTQITATSPSGINTVDIRVTTAGGTSATSASDQFTYIPAPTITGISPVSGPTAGGTSVTITGTNFTGVTAVSFGGTAATGFTFNSSTSITATSPAGTGTVDIRVTTPGGTSATSAADQFTYVVAPTITSISPIAGPTGGGTTVIITGTSLLATTGAGGVKFGATNATSYTINSSTQITATSPAGSAGTVDVTVTTPGGTSATSASDQFTYVAAPTVTSISPTSGPGSGGTVVIVTGTNFSNATAVTFGAAAATTFTVNSATQITATSPSGSNTVDIRVTTAGGTSAISAADQFTYIPAPTITGISPASGPTAGGTSVTITGTNFTGVTAVSFGGTAATGFTFNSSTSITVTSPAGTGIADIRVTTPGGQSAVVAADQFTYLGTPTVSSISPTAGPTSGGTTVIITGANLLGATGAGGVKFGATNATSYTVNSSTQITATSPAGSAGTVDVTVTTPGGTSATSASDQFTYIAAPTVTSISPTSGPGSGGTVVIVTGTNFSNATAVTFGAAAATTFTVNSSTQITATSPSGSSTVDIRVTTAGGTSATSAADQFTYIPAPTVTGITPTSGPAAGGTSVTITGANFTGVTAVSFGSTAATGFTFNSSTSITATSPAGTGTVDIRVTTPGGQSAAVAADQFTYIAAPTITSVAPNAGPVAGGTIVTITGTGFTTVSAVTFGATPATGFTVVTPTSITATAPAGTGVVDIRVTAAGGVTAVTTADQFTYVSPPTVTALSPSSGAAGGGTVVTITGTNLSSATAVSFGATAATTYTVVSATSITAISPPGAVGTVDVRVTTPGGVSALTAADQFTYLPAPTVTAIAPNAGPAIGGTSVTITGTGFTGTTGAGGVKFGAVNATSYSVNSATSITAIAPAGTGTVDVSVTNNGQTSATSAADQYSYNAAPSVAGVSPASGPAAGGTTVTITGSDFTGTSGPAGVKFGTVNATSYTVNSATTITAVSPAGTGAVDIIVTTAGQVSAASPASRFNYLSAATQTALASSQNPSVAGQPVTFTATVSSAGATPTGTVTFNDGGTAIGTATLTAGIATFSTSALTAGVHTITARYAGNAGFTASTSPALLQTVNVPIDSIRLRAMQLNVTKLIAQNSGQAISGAIFDGISEGFNDGGVLVLPSATGMRINFAAEPRDDDDLPSPATTSLNSGNHAAALGIATTTDERGERRGRAPSLRVDDAFAAIDRQTIRKAPPRWREEKEWLLWADVRRTGVDRWSNSTTPAGVNQASQSSLYGMQVNALFGLTYKVAPNFLVGMVGGWETFNYTQQDINGRLRGDGWTIGTYLGWLITPALRYDAALTYSGIGYQGSAGAAQGNFNGQRWMFATGFTGSHQIADFLLEPSLRVYALWEHQNAYTDSLGTLQGTHDFASGRASAGLRGGYPLSWFDGIVLTPYLGIYGDYYFSQANAAPLAGADDPTLASTPLLQGWSARASGGLGSKFANGAGVLIGGELGGIGSTTRIWSFSAKARVPF